MRQGRSKRRNIHEKQHRSSYQKCSLNKNVLKNFANFTAKHLCFPAKLGKFLGTPILKSICERLLLHRGCGSDADDVEKDKDKTHRLNNKTQVAKERTD